MKGFLLSCGWGTLFLTHISTVTVPLYEITVMCRHYQWYEVSQTQVFLQSLYRPGQALRVPGCQPYTLAAFTPKEIFQLIIAVIGWANARPIVWLEGLFQPKIPVTPWGIKPVTSQHVAQCLNQLCHPVPPQTHITQFTFANTHYGRNICDIQKFSTRSELHCSKHRTYN